MFVNPFTPGRSCGTMQGQVCCSAWGFRSFVKEQAIEARVRIHIGPDPLDVAEATRFVSSPEAGGNALFTGTVRSPDGDREVAYLTYEAWEGRAEQVLADLADEILERHRARRAYVAHRTGRVEVGDASVVVAVSAPHRAEAFDACRALIDAVKASAPIWKKEVGMEGERWVGMPR